MVLASGGNPGSIGDKTADWKLAEVKEGLLHSPYPSVSASPETVSAEDVTLTATIMRGTSLVGLLLDVIAPVEGKRVDFVGYKDAESTYTLLASGTVRGGAATATWRSVSGDSGTYHVTALLSDPVLPGLPYASATWGDVPAVSTVDVAVGGFQVPDAGALQPAARPSAKAIAYAKSLGGKSHLGETLYFVMCASCKTEKEAQAALNTEVQTDVAMYYIVQKSDNFEGMKPGWWVVFEARRSTPLAWDWDTYRMSYPDAYLKQATVRTSDPIPVYDDLVGL
jgi:hypothetical protein